MQFHTVLRNMDVVLTKIFNRFLLLKSLHLNMFNIYFHPCFAGLCHKACIVLFYVRSQSEKESHILCLSCIFNKIENSLLLGSFLLLFSQVSFPSGSPTVFFTALVFTAIPLMLRILQWVSVKFHPSMCSVTEFRKTLNSIACEGSHTFFTGCYANTE